MDQRTEAQTVYPSAGPASVPRLPPDSAIRHLPSQARLWSIAAAALFLDLWTKAWAFRTLSPVDTPEYLFGLVTLRRSLNPGALFGFGQGMVDVFIVASLVALLFVVYLFACSSRRQRVLHAGLAFILAGAMGNLYDRSMVKAQLVTLAASGSDPSDTFIAEVVGEPNADPVQIREWGTRSRPQPYARERIVSIRTKGVVRDFIRLELALFGRPLWPWVFNFADVALTVGVGILLVYYWVERGRPPTLKPGHTDSHTAART